MKARNIFFSEDKSFSEAEERMFARDELVYNVTEDLLVIMEDMKISKAELARRMSKSKSYISQMLDGSRNMTLGSLSDLCFALGFKPDVRLPVKPAQLSNQGWTPIVSSSADPLVMNKSTIVEFNGNDACEQWNNLNHLVAA